MSLEMSQGPPKDLNKRIFLEEGNSPAQKSTHGETKSIKMVG